MSSPPRLATAVVGAGPAGLLFCLIGRILVPDPNRWHISLFDKRREYERTHRLRIDPAPYRQIQLELDSLTFDQLIEYLDREEYRPTAKQLETYLADAVGELGIVRRQLTIGSDPGEVSLDELRSHVPPGARAADFTVVGADSVRSTVRRLVGADAGLVRESHQSVARLKLVGDDLPRRLGRVEQFKLAKLLGSVLDYRLNPNGFAEVDLFLAPEEHDNVAALGAVPADPVPLRSMDLNKLAAPLFATVVRHLEDRVGYRTEASILSTFRLEHQYSPRVAFSAPPATVFLVGDAAVSLPFFRGMASLGANAHALAATHKMILEGAGASAAAMYEANATEVVAREVEVVRRRNRMVHAAREVVSISSVVPFPLQNWLLSAPRGEDVPGATTAGVVLNAVLAVIAGAIAFTAPLLGGYVAAPLGWVWLAALPVEAVGGYAFETVRRLEDLPNRYLSGVWQIQLAILIVAGIPLTLLASRALDRPAQLYALVAWFVLGIAFVVGMRVAQRRFRGT